MKLKAIKKIKNYKSFQDFSWTTFFNVQEFHNKANIFYGENGVRKSSLCNILKSICSKKPFVNNQIPDEVCLKFDDGEYKFTNRSNVWDRNKCNDNCLFFDREFVHDNIHLGNARKTDANGQEQKSGKMIIEFDSEAIKLREARQEVKKTKKDKNDKIKKYKEDYKDTLNFPLSEYEKNLFDTYKYKTKEEIIELKKELTKEEEKIKKKLEIDKATQKKVNDI